MNNLEGGRRHDKHHMFVYTGSHYTRNLFAFAGVLALAAEITKGLTTGDWTPTPNVDAPPRMCNPVEGESLGLASSLDCAGYLDTFHYNSGKVEARADKLPNCPIDFASAGRKGAHGYFTNWRIVAMGMDSTPVTNIPIGLFPDQLAQNPTAASICPPAKLQH